MVNVTAIAERWIHDDAVETPDHGRILSDEIVVDHTDDAGEILQCFNMLVIELYGCNPRAGVDGAANETAMASAGLKADYDLG